MASCKTHFLFFSRDSASDWLKQISLAARPIRSTTQIWVVKRHQYGISALVPQTSFPEGGGGGGGGGISGSVSECRLVSQASDGMAAILNIFKIGESRNSNNSSTRIQHVVSRAKN